MKYPLRHLAIQWAAPLLVMALIFGLVQPTFAQIFEQDATLAQYVATNDIIVGSEAGSNGFRQIYFIFNGKKTFITRSNYTNADPVTDKGYIAWMGQVGGTWRIFLYHIPTGTTIQLSGGENNVSPRISEGRIAWEGWTEGAWQIFLFDGASVRQVTKGELSINPDIEGDEILYARKGSQGEWRTIKYSLGDNQAVIIKRGPAAKRPKFRNGAVVFEIEEWLKQEEAPRLAKEAKERAEEEARLAEEEPIQEESTEEEPTESEPTPEPTEPELTPSPTPTPEVTPEPTEPEPTPEPTPEPVVQEPTPEPTEPEPTPDSTPEPESTPEPTSSPTPTPEVTPEPTESEPTPEPTPESVVEEPTEPEPEPTQPEPVTEEDIIEELEGMPLAEEEIDIITESAPDPEPSAESN